MRPRTTIQTKQHHPIFPYTMTQQAFTPASAKTTLAVPDVLRFNIRDFMPGYSRLLTRRMENEEFVQDYEGLIYVTYRGKLYLINGRHRLESLTNVKDPNFTLDFSAKTYDLNQSDPTEWEQDIKTMFTKIDRGKARSINLIAPELMDDIGASNEKEVEAILGATGCIGKNFNNYINAASVEGASPDFRKADVRKWCDEARLYLLAIRGQREYKAFLRSTVVAVALATIRYSPVKAVEFWREAASGGAFATTDPRRRILDFCHNWTKEKMCRVGIQTRLTAACWNAWAKGEEIEKSPALKNHAAAILIMGTDWKRGKGQVTPETAKKLHVTHDLSLVFPNAFPNAFDRITYPTRGDIKGDDDCKCTIKRACPPHAALFDAAMTEYVRRVSIALTPSRRLQVAA